MQMGAKVKEWRNLDYSEMVRRLFMTPGEDAMNICREITFQVTGSCTPVSYTHLTLPTT